MKRALYALAVLLLTVPGFAQNDTTRSNEPDTIKVGNFVIIKKNKGSNSDSSNQSNSRIIVDISTKGADYDHTKSRHSNISTNWFILDLGFANLRDETIYGSPEANNYLTSNGNAPFTGSDLDLNNGKSSNVNVWLFMQKLHVLKNVLNLKYGLGIEMYNYRYSNNISYQKSPPSIIRDTIDFSKNKLAADFVTIPIMVSINPFPNRRQGLSFSVGVSAGYLYNSRNKQVSDERGKQKTKGDFDLNPWRLAYIGELGIGPVRVYGSYSYNTLHEYGLKQYPYTIGLRLSNW